MPGEMTTTCFVGNVCAQAPIRQRAENELTSIALVHLLLRRPLLHILIGLLRATVPTLIRRAAWRGQRVLQAKPAMMSRSLS
jgi:hypothetical protein